MISGRHLMLVWLPPIAATLGVSVVLVLVSRLVDWWVFQQATPVPFDHWFLNVDPSAIQTVILSTLEVLAGVFAISITVVAIIVQLSAARVTSRVVDLFLADPFNSVIFFLYVVPLVLGFWEANAITDDGFSRTGVGIFMVLSTLAMVLVFPYFKYVFYFLQPQNIIDKIESSVNHALRSAARHPREIPQARGEVTKSIQQLSDITLTAIANNDLVFAVASLNAMKQVLMRYLELKPQFSRAWHEIPSQHILGLSEEMWQEVVDSRTWVEMELFKQYEIAFTTSLRKVRDITSCVARNVRDIAEMAVRLGATETRDFLIKGFNTFIMYALSERDIRSAVHVLYQYRLLAETLLDDADTVGRIGKHLLYYGQNSQRRSIYFITDAVAYDLRELIQEATRRNSPSMEPLLAAFLELDQVTEGPEGIKFRRGVRKSQAILAGFFIQQGRRDLAERIRQDMAGEPREFLTAVKQELLAVTEEEFWEIEDRGVTFYYVEPENRDAIREFFDWLFAAATPRHTPLSV
jgi:hypothetical protein